MKDDKYTIQFNDEQLSDVLTAIGNHYTYVKGKPLIDHISAQLQTKENGRSQDARKREPERSKTNREKSDETGTGDGDGSHKKTRSSSTHS